jgi:RimJ/RimL family protein N-acetyltransferase
MDKLDRALGEMLSWKGAPPPEPSILAGTTVRLEPVAPDSHAQPLYTASHNLDGDPHLWDYMSVGPFKDQAEFAGWLETIAHSKDPLFFAVVDQETGLPAGMASYMRVNPRNGVIEIGNIWFGSRLQRTRQATEAIFLLASHVFDELGYRRLEWKCDALNERSRRAAERFGFTYEGMFRQHMVVKGRNRDTAWYAMLDHEWPLIRAAFQRWLAPDNFDSAGRQRYSLAAIRASTPSPGGPATT